MKVYFDNAATTPLAPEVFGAMKPYMTDFFGNPSSIHSHGRQARSGIERARKSVAAFLNVSPSEIFFTSGGTEADITAIRSGVEALSIQHAITSPLEHHAVLHNLEHLRDQGKLELHMVEVNQRGEIDYEDLERLVTQNSNCLVSLIHANNEIGNILDLDRVGELCDEHKAILHSDTVQSVGHYEMDLQRIKANFIVGSAHKFHGPKGIGFLYINGQTKIPPFMIGGTQERNMRGGTENLYGIVGLARAMELAYGHLDHDRQIISSLKKRMITRLMEKIPGVEFNGRSAEEDSLFTVLNVSLPPSFDNEMLLFNLDIAQISASGGSACASGSNVGSHVLEALDVDPNRGAIRFSFSKYNKADEVDYVVEKLAELNSVEA